MRLNFHRMNPSRGSKGKSWMQNQSVVGVNVSREVATSLEEVQHSVLAIPPPLTLWRAAGHGVQAH